MKLYYDSNDRDDGTFDRCPFCGGEADARPYVPPFCEYAVFYYVQCEDCGAMTKPCLSVPKAIKLWNKRICKEETE